MCYGPEGGSAIIRVIGGSAPYFYSIDNQESVSFGEAGSSQTTFTIQNIKPGGHSITITDSNSCSVEELSVSISMPNPISISHFNKIKLSQLGVIRLEAYQFLLQEVLHHIFIHGAALRVIILHQPHLR